jgi:hypothetical protein
MVNTSNDKAVGELYAFSEEVEALKAKLETFMQEQDIHNKTISTSLEKLLKLAEESGAKLQDPLVEDKGSSVKGKDTSKSYKIPQLRRSDYCRDQQMHKKVNFAPSSSTMVNKTLPPQPAQYQHSSQDGQYDDDEYTIFGQEDGEEYTEHPWNLYEHEEHFPKQPYTPPLSNPNPNPIPNPSTTTPNYIKQFPHNSHSQAYTAYNLHTAKEKPHQPVNHNYNQHTNPNPYYTYQPPPVQNFNQNFHQQMHYQHKAIARGPKLNFPEFSGEDVEGWIRKAEKYFELIGVPNEDRVQIAIMYISGKAEFWWRGTGCNARTLPWHQFCRMASDRFNVISEYEIVGQFHNLKQIGTIGDYIDRFEEMVSMVKRHNPTLSDNYFISSFISGLKDQIQYHVQCHKPITLPQAFWYAKRLEQSTPAFRKFANYTPPTRILNKATEIPPKAIEAKEKLPAQTITELRAAGKCFKCRDPWVPGHGKICKAKQVYSVILVEDEDGKEEVAVIEDCDASTDPDTEAFQDIKTCKISVSAFSGTPTTANTFTLRLHIGSRVAVALVDSGSDVSFISSSFAIKSQCLITQVEGVKVAAAHGKQMLSTTACLNCPYNIQGHEFHSDFRLLELKGYDVILGADWIYTHSPVGLDLRRREFSITKEGTHLVTFSDETILNSNQVIGP